METWRLRTPNDWEHLGAWTNVLCWRNHVYNTVIHSFKGLSEINPVLHQLGYRDKAWSVNRYELRTVAAVQLRHGYFAAASVSAEV